MSNATELVMQKVPEVVDQHLHPIMDLTPLWGWPLWVFVFIAMGIVLLVINMKWLRRRMILSPTLEYLSAFKSGLQEDMQTWMFGKNRSFFIKHLRYHDDGVISYHNFLQKISMWYLSSPLAVGHAGGIKSVIVSDNYDMVRDFVAEIAMCTAIRKYNEANKVQVKDSDGAILIDETGSPVVTYPITNYFDYEKCRKDMERMFPSSIPIDTYCYFNPLEAQQFFPPNRTAGMMGGDCIREARKKNIDTKEESNWIKFAPLGIALVIGLLSILVVYMYVTGGK